MISQSRSRYQRGYVRIRNGYWVGEWRGEPNVDGKRPQHSKQLYKAEVYRTKTEYKDAKKAAETYLFAKFISPKVDESGECADTTVRQYVDGEYLPRMKRRWAANSYTGIKCILKHFVSRLGDVELRSITRTMIEDLLLDYRDEGMGYWQLRLLQAAMHGMFQEAVAQEPARLNRNPMLRLAVLRNIEPPKDPRSLTLDEARRVYAVTGRDGLMWKIALVCGLRQGEIAALKHEDLLDDAIVVDQSRTEKRKLKVPKNRKIRVQPLPPILSKLLHMHAGSTRVKSGKAHLFTAQGRSGELPLSQGWMWHAILKARVESAVEDLTWKMCRTTFATLLEGRDKDIEDLMGHMGRTVTAKHYRRAIPQDQVRAVAELEQKLLGGRGMRIVSARGQAG